MRPIIALCSVVIFVTLLSSCANPVSPTGGTKDTKGPALIKTTPQKFSLSSSPQKIIFYFDENIVVTNAEKNIIISPYPGKIKITHTNKSLTILLNKDSLKSNTTYSVYLNNSIADLNENNPGTYAPLMFSTGNKLDSFSILGSLADAPKTKTDNYKIICYDSGNFKTGPFYFNKLTGKIFYTSGMDSTEKDVVVFNDINNDNKPDDAEEIGYRSKIKPAKDSLRINIYSRLKKQVNVYEEAGINFISGVDPFTSQKIVTSVPSVYIFKDTIVSLRTNLPIILGNLPASGYIQPTLLNEQKISPIQFNIETDYEDSTRHVLITFNHPIKSLKKENISCSSTIDSLYKCQLNVVEHINALKIGVSDAKRTLVIKIPTSVVLFDNLKTLPKEITANLEEVNSRGALLLQNTQESPLAITLSGNKTTISIYIPSKSQKTLYVPRGTYNIKYFVDVNQDYLTTPPDPEKYYEGEKLKTKDNIIAKPGLLNTIILD